MSPLIPYLYNYGVGGAVFLVGLYFAWRHNYINLSAPGLRNLAVCLFAIGFFAVIQGYLQFAPMREAKPIAYQGGAQRFVDDDHIRGEPIDYAIMIGYFLTILAVGTWFARNQKTTKDFFLGGQRFSWWLISFSLIATTVGSYSFVKYSNKGFGYGLSSSQTYLNDWIWLPIVAFGWLPILYFSRVNSVPEYLGRRFDGKVRFWATLLVLVYLIGYVGVNLFTMGKVLNALLGWEIWAAAMLVAAISCTYVTAGGQTSVIMTDLLQGVMLLVVGAIILALGISYVGGFEAFWAHLPRESRLAFPNFNQDSKFPSVGIFWQDAMANSAMLYLINQGIIMRFLATKSLAESRKAVFAMVVGLMVIGACVVGGGGWVANALVHSGHLPADIKSDQAFYIATEMLCKPGVFGLVLAALTAALMSTVDTLITAVASLVVNDVYKPYIRPAAADRELLRVARIRSVSVTVLGVALVPVFMQFKSIYTAHGAFTAAITPPLVVTLLLAVFWRRFTRTAAICTLVGGLAAIGVSLFVPEVIAPFSHGVPMAEVDPDKAGFFSGMTQFKFMRAFYGLVVSAVIGVVVSLFTKPEPWEKQRGLVWGTINHALERFKGSPGNETASRSALATPVVGKTDDVTSDGQERPRVRISPALARSLAAEPGDLLYVTDRRRWLGGLRSTHAVVAEVLERSDDEATIELGPTAAEAVIAPRRQGRPVRVERLY